MRMRCEVHAVVEYDINVDDYRQDETVDITPAEVAAMDLETAEEDVYMFLDSEDTKWKITVTPIGDNE